MSDTKRTYSDSALEDMCIRLLDRYSTDIDKMFPQNTKSFLIPYSDLIEIPDLFDVMQTEPNRIIKAASSALVRVIAVRNSAYSQAHDFTARFSQYPEPKDIRGIDYTLLGKFIGVKGMLIRSSAVESLPVNSYVQKGMKTSGTLTLTFHWRTW